MMKRVLQCLVLLLAVDTIIDISINANISKMESSIDKITYELNEIEIEIDNIEDKVEMPTHTRIEEFDTEEQIQEEIRLGEMELLAQLVHAEAGTEDLDGKRLVADVVLNRVDDEDFPDTVEEVIFQKLDNYMFSSVGDGNFDRAGWEMLESDYEAVLMEYGIEKTYRRDPRVIYFRTDHYSEYGHPLYRHGAHYFSCK